MLYTFCFFQLSWFCPKEKSNRPIVKFLVKLYWYVKTWLRTLTYLEICLAFALIKEEDVSNIVVHRILFYAQRLRDNSFKSFRLEMVSYNNSSERYWVVKLLIIWFWQLRYVKYIFLMRTLSREGLKSKIQPLELSS